LIYLQNDVFFDRILEQRFIDRTFEASTMDQEEVIGENVEIDEDTARTISDAILISRIIQLTPAPMPSPGWKRFLKSPLFSLAFSLVLGFLLTGLVGTYLTYYYNHKQSELEHQRNLDLKDREHDRSFADELNKIRVAKISEVYEKFYVYEAAVQEVMQGVRVNSDSPRQGEVLLAPGKNLKEALEQSKFPQKELLEVLNKNRGWIEDNNYYNIKQYAEFLYEHQFAVQTKQDLEGFDERRSQAMASLTELRDRMQQKK